VGLEFDLSSNDQPCESPDGVDTPAPCLNWRVRSAGDHGADIRHTGAWLNIRGLRVPGGVSPIVNVFADLPPGTTSVSTDDPHYVGYLANVPSKPTQPNAVAVLSGGTLDATKALSRLGFYDRTIAITLAPAEDGRADAPVSADQVYFTVD
jgi:hypothetical protein